MHCGLVAPVVPLAQFVSTPSREVFGHAVAPTLDLQTLGMLMGLALLPWEKLPIWALSPLMITLGAFLLFNAEPLSWRQLEALAIFVIGAWMLICGVKKLLAKPSDAKCATLPNEMPGTADDKPTVPDFGKYTEAELCQILTRLDGERFPERVKDVEERLASYKKIQQIHD